MRDEHAFVEAILAEPDDTSARLIFADWLEERGDPRGEFIRIQCALSGNHLDDLQRHRFTVREQELLSLHEAEWSAPFQGIALDATFRRGFVEQVIFETDAFLEKAVELVQLAPIQQVALKKVGTAIADVAEHPLLARLEGLVLRGNNLGDTGAEILARHARFSRLRHLDLGMNLIEIAGARSLAESTHLARLNTLLIEQNPIQDMGVYALASSPHLGRLTTLSLGYCHLTATGARYVAESKTLPNLETLDLSHNELGDPGARALVKSTRLTQLRSLNLRGNGIGHTGIKDLVEAPHLGQLAFLDLGENPINGRQREMLRCRFGKDMCRF